MYTSTSAIIQACNNSNSNYKHFCISNLLQPSESLFKFFYLFSFKHFIPSSIQIYTRKRWYILHKILDKIRKTNFIIDQFKEKNLLTTPITCIVIGIRRLTINLAFASVVDSMHIAWASIFHHFSSLPSFSFFLLFFITVFHTRIDYIYIIMPSKPVIKPLSRTKRVTMERWLLEILFVLQPIAIRVWNLLVRWTTSRESLSF